MLLARLLVPALVLGAIPSAAFPPPPDRLPDAGSRVALAPLFVRDGSRFFARGTGIVATPEGLRFSLSDTGGTSQRWGVAADFLGARRTVPQAQGLTTARVSYFRGAPSLWRTGLSTSEGLVYRGLWEGIDLAARATRVGVKYEYRLAPGADASRIRVAYRGARELSLHPDGSLVVSTPAGAIVDAAPFAYQLRDGRRVRVPAAYDLRGSRVGFLLGAYDAALPLVIDPAVYVYSGFIGGAQEDQGVGIAADATGNVYVTGITESAETTFPEVVGPDPTFGGGTDPDAFVAKVAPGGSLVYAGYIGGSKKDQGEGIAVDASGAAYVTGFTESPDFGVTPGAYDTSFNPPPDRDAWVVKVRPDGTGVVYSTFLGGHGGDEGRAIAVDATGSAYVAGFGRTDAAPFPTTDGSFGTTHAGMADAFVAKLNPAGSGLVYSGLLGGDQSDTAQSLALAADGSVAIVGNTGSSEATFPEKVGPDLTHNGPSGTSVDAVDGFVAQIDPTGSTIVFAGYLGGSVRDQASGVAMDPGGGVYVSGFTASPDFPALVGPDTTYEGADSNGFITKVSPGGASLAYSGFLGGVSFDEAASVVVDPSGSAVVAGSTTSTQETFPLGGGPDPVFSGGTWDGFVVRVDPTGSGLIGGTFIGGSGLDVISDVALLGAGDFAVVGSTSSKEPHFPLTASPDPTHNGGSFDFDAFVTRFQVSGTCFGQPVTRFGTPGEDDFVGTPGVDVFLGFEGDDVLNGLGGNDLLCGGDDDDTLIGGPGGDRLLGEPGDDRLIGNGGRDRLLGGAGEDRLLGGGGKDRLNGGAQTDTCNGGAAADRARKCETAKRI